MATPPVPDSDILQRVKEEVAAFTKVEVEFVSSRMKLDCPDLDMDSMDVLSLVLRLDRTFGIEIPDERLNQLHTVADLSRLVKEGQNALECAT